MLEKIKHYIEYAGLKLLFTAFAILPLDIASYIGGFMARSIGYFLSANKTAIANISSVFPELSKKEQEKLLAKMWDNLGRVAAELAHLQKNNFINRIKITGLENLPAQGKPAFLFSGHVGNWELLACVANHQGRPITAVYREANNKLVDKFIADIRAKHCAGIIPKGSQGAVKIVRAIKNNAAIAMLVDQKMNDGISVPFFGRDAMTAPAIAQLAIRYDAPIIPARVIRTKGANFEVVIYPALEFAKTDTDTQIMTQINTILESWIKEKTEQWFWVHKRWKK